MLLSFIQLQLILHQNSSKIVLTTSYTLQWRIKGVGKEGNRSQAALFGGQQISMGAFFRRFTMI